MRAGDRKTSEQKSEKHEANIVTAGEDFPDGIIDLVASPDPCRPDLVLWDSHLTTVSPRIRHRGLWYRAPELQPTIGRKMRFPRRVELNSSVGELFCRFFGAVTKIPGAPAGRSSARDSVGWHHLGFGQTTIPAGSHHFRAEYAPGGRSVPVTSSLGSRRALAITGINRATLAGLPMDLRPSLLINQPDLPETMSRLLGAANHRGLQVLARNGAFQDWVGSKAIFLGVSPSTTWEGEALRISLPAPAVNLPPLTKRDSIESHRTSSPDSWVSG